MNREEIKKQLTEELESLGMTPTDVVKVLREKGVKGRRDNAAGCPVAIYLDEHTDINSAYLIEVCRTRTYVGYGETVEVSTPNPNAIQLFVKHFDNGAFADLVVEGGEG